MKTELDSAIAISQGKLASPFFVETTGYWLVDMRITGTGFSYRPESETFVYRDHGFYTSDTVKAMCSGLPVIINHGDFEDSVIIGTVFYPFVRGDELRCIAKIVNKAAMQQMTQNYVSTSPSFQAPTIKFEDVDIDLPPLSVKHLAILFNGEIGVWDKFRADLLKSAVNIKSEVNMLEEENESAGHEEQESSVLNEILARLKKQDDDMGQLFGAVQQLQSSQAPAASEAPAADLGAVPAPAPAPTADADLVSGVAGKVQNLNDQFDKMREEQTNALNMPSADAEQIATMKNDSSTISRALLGIEKRTAVLPQDTIQSFKRRHVGNLQGILKEYGATHGFISEDVQNLSDSMLGVVATTLTDLAKGLSRTPTAHAPMVKSTVQNGHKTTTDRSFLGGFKSFAQTNRLVGG